MMPTKLPPPPRAGKQGAGASCCSKTRWAQLAGPARRRVQDSRLLTHQSFRRSQIGKGCPPRSPEGTRLVVFPRAPTMSGRGGRGRGRGANLTFNIEAVGIGKGEALPPPTLQPSPLFPPLEYKPVPLQTGEEVEYMLALKQELRGAMKNSPYFLKPSAPKKDVERYSDKYQTSGPVDSTTEWTPDWRQFPPELKTRVRKIKKQRATVAPKSKTPLPTDKEEAIKKLETLEKKEEEVTSEEEEEKEEGEEGKEEEEEEYDEEEFEEETDYIMSYFDNGEDFGGDSDENMDEAIY